jgi:hypothetical protein
VAIHDFSRVHSSYQATSAASAKKHLVYCHLTEDFYPTLNSAIQLNNHHYLNVMLATGIIQKKENKLQLLFDI